MPCSLPILSGCETTVHIHFSVPAAHGGAGREETFLLFLLEVQKAELALVGHLVASVSIGHPVQSPAVGTSAWLAQATHQQGAVLRFSQRSLLPQRFGGPTGSPPFVPG